MRKLIILTIVVAITALGYLGYAHLTGGAVPTFGLPIGGEKARIRHRVSAFFEDVKFKNSPALRDFVKSGTNPDEIFAYLTQTLGFDINTIDLTGVKIQSIEMDSAETRARVIVSISIQDLSQKKAHVLERLIFLFQTPDGKWLIDLNNL